MYKLLDLPYDYSALEPFIDEQTMRFHHDKHHQTYTDKFNAALEGLNLTGPAEDILKNLNQIPDNVRTAVRNHGGGFVNHNLFWEIMGPNAGGVAEGEIGKMINHTFGSFDKFKEQFTASAVGVFGSGWAWLVLNNGKLEITTTPNQDSPLSVGKTPLLTIDVWEHSYYLKYQNKRPDYVAAWWNVVNWEEVEKRLKQVMR